MSVDLDLRKFWGFRLTRKSYSTCYELIVSLLGCWELGNDLCLDRDPVTTLFDGQIDEGFGAANAGYGPQFVSQEVSQIFR